MSENSKIVISNRGKVTGSMRALMWIFGIVLFVVGIMCFSSGLDAEGGYGADEYLPFILLGGGMVVLTTGILLIIWDIMYQKSFLELATDGVCGASFTMKGVFRITPPRKFELNYSDIQRIDSEKGFLLVVTSSETYRCRAKGMEEDFRKAFKNMAHK